MKDIFDLIGRLFISMIFLYQAFMYFSKRVASDFLSIGEIILLVLGSLLLVLGYRSKLGAVLLLILLIPRMALYFLDFNNAQNQEMFMYNIGLIGGLFIILANGSGKYSIKKILARARK
jgi:putative oxidoreductase